MHIVRFGGICWLNLVVLSVNCDNTIVIEYTGRNPCWSVAGRCVAIRQDAS